MPETRYDNRSARPPLVWRWPAARRRRGLPLAHPRVLLALFVLAAVIALLIVAGTARALGA